MDYFVGLNDPQQEAVRYLDGPLMIIAGAGSGKTKVLTTRIAHLIHKGIDPFQILALTFTNKAAREMKERVEKILDNNEARNLYIGTFHSVFARILRFEANHLGYPNNFTIYDSDDAKSVLKTIIHENNLDDKHYKPSLIYNRISSAKNQLISYIDYAKDFHFQQEDSINNRPMIASLFEFYVKRCFKNGAMDFDDLLYNMYILLKNLPDILNKYQHKFKYILIDEFQDTNPAQYEIIKLLSAVYKNICIVGDDAQSIYSFRGATIKNILQFKNDFSDVKVIKLEQNYRSTKSILHAANGVIIHNKIQIEKALWTENEEGEKIKLIKTKTDNEEGKLVSDTIAELKLRNHFRNRDFAILYRTNAQSRSFEESLRRLNIAYRIYGGISFYQRKEIKDFLSYLRVIVNPMDEENLKHIINYPVRGIGKTTIEKIIQFSNQENISFWESLSRIPEIGFRGMVKNNINEFVLMIKNLQAMLQKNNAYDIAMNMSKTTGLLKELFNDKSIEGVNRYDNIEELLNSIKEFTETQTDEGELQDKRLGSYLQQITLLTDADSDKEDQDVVKLMTIHAAKGLEFPCVFVVGLEEGLFPNIMATYNREDLEEERRLFYVAVTRAKLKLYLSHSNTRYHFGNLQQNDPSRFLDEIPENYIENSYASVNTWTTNVGKSIPKHNIKIPSSGVQSRMKSLEYPLTEFVLETNFIPDDPVKMKIGTEVEHQKFGFGRILNIEGSPSNLVATILFPNFGGEKKIILGYAKLRIIDNSKSKDIENNESIKRL